MFRTARRPFGNVALLLVLAPTIAGCMTTRRTAFHDNTVGLDRITGVTMSSGREIKFSEPGASITNDTMYAVGRQGQLLLPTDSIAGVSVRKVSAGRTVGLVAALAVVGIVIIAVSSLNLNMKFQPVVADRH